MLFALDSTARQSRASLSPLFARSHSKAKRRRDFVLVLVFSLVVVFDFVADFVSFCVCVCVCVCLCMCECMSQRKFTSGLMHAILFTKADAVEREEDVEGIDERTAWQ